MRLRITHITYNTNCIVRNCCSIYTYQITIGTKVITILQGVI